MSFSFHHTGFIQGICKDNQFFSQPVETIVLEAHERSTLNWKLEKEKATEAKKRNVAILWEFQLDFPSSSFFDETSFLTLEIALKHFKESFWPSFEKHSIGAILYRGPADFKARFPWNFELKERYTQWLEGYPETPFLESLFCQKVSLDYLELLVSALPEELLPFLAFEKTETCFSHFIALTSRERFPHFYIFSEKDPEQIHRFPAVKWSKRTQSPLKRFTKGFLLPHSSKRDEFIWTKAADIIKNSFEPLLILSEQHLPHEWDGLDEISVIEEGQTPLGKRKLLGFQAAGGMITTL